MRPSDYAWAVAEQDRSQPKRWVLARINGSQFSGTIAVVTEDPFGARFHWEVSCRRTEARGTAASEADAKRECETIAFRRRSSRLAVPLVRAGRRQTA